jgi:hypothetical protein
MLDRYKVIAALQKASSDLFVGFAHERDIALTVWQKIAQEADFAAKIAQKKQPILVPFWQGLLGQVIDLQPFLDSYAVISVDGSQIYYDKHQGSPCFLINTGWMVLRYKVSGKSIDHGSEPFLYTKFDEDSDFGSPDFVNLQRELHEFERSLELMFENKSIATTLCLFDGSLIFFHLDAQDMELKERFMALYTDVLEKMYQEKLLIAGYVSLPKTKELVNLCKLELAQHDVAALEHTKIIDRLNDCDIAFAYLQPYQRSTVFVSKAPVCYLYPSHLKPYFCYLHVGKEIARLEFPAWIGKDENLVDTICSIVIDQVIKGQGYPVSLFEAHEQAVVKADDREFFYLMMERLSQQQFKSYVSSQKSIKKQQPIL